MNPKPDQEGICTSCGHKDSIEFVAEKWRWVNGTTFTRTNCPSCDEWRSLSVLETKIETVPLIEAP